MNKGLLILSAVILAVVLGGGAFFLYSKNYSTPTSSPVQEQAPTESVSENPISTPAASSEVMTNEKAEIILDSSDFSPKEKTIKKGATVVWTNNSGKTATVHSAPHPTHTNYPPLNLGNFNDGQSLELTFNEAGTYRYHNHLDASQNGSITVE